MRVGSFSEAAWAVMASRWACSAAAWLSSSVWCSRIRLRYRGGGAGVVAELGEFADQAFLAGFVAGDPLAELGGLGVAARGGLSRRRRQLSLQHRGPVVSEHELVQEGGDRGGDGVLADGGPDVAGAAVHVAGVALAPRAHVVGVALSRAPPRAGRSGHPPPALRAVQPRPQRVPAPGAAGGHLGVPHPLMGRADLLGLFPELTGDQGGVDRGRGPGPLLAGTLRILRCPGRWDLPVFFVRSYTMNPVYFGFARIFPTVMGPQPPLPGLGTPAASSRPAIASRDSCSSTRHSNILVTHGPACESTANRVRTRPWPAFIGTGWAIRSAV